MYSVHHHFRITYFIIYDTDSDSEDSSGTLSTTSSDSSTTTDASDQSDDETAFKRRRRSRSKSVHKDSDTSSLAMNDLNAFIDKNEKLIKCAKICK